MKMLSLTGGALAGLGASACCAGPLLLVSIGVSGAWISNLTALEPYRWAFALAALGFMGHAWTKIYRAPAAAQCEPGTACAAPQSRRVQRVLFWVVSVLVAAALAFPYLVSWLVAPAHAAPQTVVLAVPTMNCAACPITVKKALQKVPGVSAVKATLEPPQATVTFDDAATSVEKLLEATRNAGYPATQKQ